MPEGPEVRISADKIGKAVGGVPLTSIFEFPVLVPYQDQFESVVLDSVDTYGKSFVLNFANQLCIYVHLQLYGRWKIGTLRSLKPSNRTVRFSLRSNTHHATLYSATEIEVLTPDQVPHHKFIRKLGPDILRKGYRASHISRRLAKPKFARRRLGGLLLNQSMFSGLGNYLRSEILFRSKLLPNRTLGSLTDPERTLLAKMIHQTTLRTYETKGITLDQSYVNQAKLNGLKRSQYRHFVFDREGAPCWICSTTIEKFQVSGRRLYLCKNCQM